jgi:hypothetical protein
MKPPIKLVAKCCVWIASTCLAAMMLLTVADVVLRAVCNYPIRGAYEIVELLLCPTFFMALPAAFLRDRHIVVDASIGMSRAWCHGSSAWYGSLRWRCSCSWPGRGALPPAMPGYSVMSRPISHCRKSSTGSRSCLVSLVGQWPHSHELWRAAMSTTTIGLCGIVTWVQNQQLSPMLIMCSVMLLYICLGTFLDEVSMILITVPVTLPLINSIGYNGVWFGIFVTVMCTIGLISPPTGMTVFVVQAQNPDIPVEQIYLGTLPFLVADFVLIALLVAFPDVALWIPRLLGM